VKRLFDLVVAALLLAMAAPFVGLIALLIRLDSPGPVLYAVPKVGKDGRVFGMVRFRTVDVSKPHHLSMNERLTRVGRFIRELSLDDLPNLLNIFTGDLSVIGPRPTEPERVDRADPAWQQILTVKPGMISPAILALGQRYNASPAAVKQQLELAYVRQQSFRYDLHLFWQAMRGYVASKGNWKARGKPMVAIEYATYQPKRPPAPASWQVIDWQRPDLSSVVLFVQEQGQGWAPYSPHFCLVPCGDSGQKPALFLKVAQDYEQWASHAVLQDVRWPVVANNRYLCLGCTLYFADATGAALRLGTVGERRRPGAPAHRLACSALLDVASPAVEAWFSAWQQMSGAIPLFVVSADLASIDHRSFTPHAAPDPSALKAQAMQQWQAVRTRLAQSNHALENFPAEQEMLFNTLPHGVGWEPE
jgi:lipopolysaccharide/colanic/teichoic acid biosynthesis glycosyltransferase